MRLNKLYHYYINSILTFYINKIKSQLWYDDTKKYKIIKGANCALIFESISLWPFAPWLLGSLFCRESQQKRFRPKS